jgi:hypothetical protein
MKPQSDAEVLYDYTVQCLQVSMLEARIKELEEIKNKIAGRRDDNFKIYRDRLKQRGKEIDLPDFTQDVDEALNS